MNNFYLNYIGIFWNNTHWEIDEVFLENHLKNFHLNNITQMKYYRIVGVSKVLCVPLKTQFFNQSNWFWHVKSAAWSYLNWGLKFNSLPCKF